MTQENVILPSNAAWTLLFNDPTWRADKGPDPGTADVLLKLIAISLITVVWGQLVVATRRCHPTGQIRITACVGLVLFWEALRCCVLSAE